MSIYGHTLRVFSKTTMHLRHHLHEVLSARGIAVKNIRAVTPTLEDVFMSLIRGASDGNGGR